MGSNEQSLRWDISQYMQKWLTGAEQQATRAIGALHDPDAQDLELHFYVMALYHIERGAKWAQRELVGEGRRRLNNAISHFMQAAPDVRHIRGILEHFIAYESGLDIGGSEKRLPTVPTPTPMWREATEDDVVLHISSSRRKGSYTLRVSPSLEAARALAAEIIEVFEGPSVRFASDRVRTVRRRLSILVEGIPALWARLR